MWKVLPSAHRANVIAVARRAARKDAQKNHIE
jgi:hypothetical protein